MIFELGSYVVEVHGRSRRHFAALSEGAEKARQALLIGDRRPRRRRSARCRAARRCAGRSTSSSPTPHTDGGDHQLNKALADFDFDAQRRLARTRLLVRAGPALGLMGTLIPLSPALTGLANGNTAALSQNLGSPSASPWLGLLIGAVAFGLSLSRDRMYGQDLSDLEYLAAIISDPRPARRVPRDHGQPSCPQP